MCQKSCSRYPNSPFEHHQLRKPVVLEPPQVTKAFEGVTTTKQSQKVSKLGAVKGKAGIPQEVTVASPTISTSSSEKHEEEDTSSDRLGMATAFRSAEIKKPRNLYILSDSKLQ